MNSTDSVGAGKGHKKVLRLFAHRFSEGTQSMAYTDIMVQEWEVVGQLLVLHMPDGRICYRPLMSIESFGEVQVFEG